MSLLLGNVKNVKDTNSYVPAAVCFLSVCFSMRASYLLNSKSSFSKMRMGPVELRMMRGCPPNRQKTVPAKAVPRKLSITP